MAFTTPRDWVTGEVITASIGNTHWRDQFRYFKGLDGAPLIERGLEVDNTLGTEYFKLPALTTTERNALSPAEGWKIWNETKKVEETYTGAAWVEHVAPVVTGVHGAIPFRGASVPEWFAAGTSGLFLQTQGAGANPIWGAAGGPLMARSFPATGRYYGCARILPNPTTLAIAADRLYAMPFIAGRTVTFDRIALYVSGTGAGNVRMGIYSSTNGGPGALVDDSGTVSVSTTGSKEITISQELAIGGLYWLAVVSDVAPTLFAFLDTEALTAIAGAGNPNESQDFTFAYKAFTFAALPDPWGTPTWASGKVPHLTLRSS